MHKLLSPWLALFILSSCVGISYYIRTEQQMGEINDSVVALVDTEDGAPYVFCSGSFIGRYKIITAAHCVVGTDEVEIATYRSYVATGSRVTEDTRLSLFFVAHRAAELDLAVLLAVDDTVTAHHVLRVAALPPVQGERVILVGHPYGLSWSLTQGVVSSDYRVGLPNGQPGPTPLYIQHDASAAMGSSGGPLLNHDNELVGVMVQGVANYGALSLSVHTTLIHRFLQEDL